MKGTENDANEISQTFQDASLATTSNNESSKSFNNRKRTAMRRRLLLLTSIVLFAGLFISTFNILQFIKTEAVSQAHRGEISVVMDGFIRALDNRDLAEAAKYYPFSMLDQTINSTAYAGFDDYESLSLTNLTVCETTRCMVPDTMWGHVRNIPSAVAFATIRHADGTTSAFRAVLWQPENKWLIYEFAVTPSQERVDSFLVKYPNIDITARAAFEEFWTYGPATVVPTQPN